jgi:hypothetical protein
MGFMEMQELPKLGLLIKPWLTLLKETLKPLQEDLGRTTGRPFSHQQELLRLKT